MTNTPPLIWTGNLRARNTVTGVTVPVKLVADDECARVNGWRGISSYLEGPEDYFWSLFQEDGSGIDKRCPWIIEQADEPSPDTTANGGAPVDVAGLRELLAKATARPPMPLHVQGAAPADLAPRIDRYLAAAPVPAQPGITFTKARPVIFDEEDHDAPVPADSAKDAGMVEAVALWLVWSNEHRAFWAPNRCGYTGRIERAGRYSRAEAEAICRNANVRANSSIREGTPPEICMPAPEAFALIEAQVTERCAEVARREVESCDAQWSMAHTQSRFEMAAVWIGRKRIAEAIEAAIRALSPAGDAGGGEK